MSEKIDVEYVQRLRVEPGDVLLVTVPDGTPPAQIERIKNLFETNLPIRALVKTTNVRIEVVGQERTR